MKKLLLSMAAVALSMSAATAAEVVLDLKDATNFVGTENPEALKDDGTLKNARNFQPVESFECGNYKFTATSGSNTSNAPAFYFTPSTNTKTPNTFRVYVNNTFTVAAPAGTEMTQIEFTLQANSKKNTFTANSGTVAHDADNSNLVITWTGAASSVEFTAGGSIQIKSMTITTGNATMETLTAPVFEPAAGTSFADQLAVSITAETGADIYYTLDGTNPTTASSKYDAPIVLTATTTVKAMAVKDGFNDSPVATATYTKEEVMETLSDIIAAGLEDETTEFTFGGKAVVTYVNGSNLYVRDETASLLVYGKLNTTYTQGDVLTGFKGTFKNYYSTYELMANANSFGQPVETMEVTPEEFTLATITPNDQNAYIILRSVEADTEALTLTQGSDSMALYNKFNMELPASGKYDVVGLVSYYQAKGADAAELQIYPVAFQDPTSVESVEATEGIYVQGGNIIAPADAQIFNISGARVAGNNLQSGVYVVRTQTAAVKVLVK